MPIKSGDILGQYEILEELGRGGMATVFRARQRAMNRDVAIKVLPEQYLHDPNFLARFTTEAHVIAGLEHRSILPVYDYGEAGGTPYIVMRLMPAGSLRGRLRGGPLPPAETGRLISQIAEALDYAHRRGVIHRDLKPDNVLVDDQGHAYLSDFGIAKVMETTAQTSGSRIVGTPSYMAPEQAKGGRPSPATDIYALGAMTFEILTGRPPFLADDFISLLFQHASEPVPRLRDLNPAVPEALQPVLERALAKDPAARFVSASDMAADFQRSLAGLPLGAPPPEATLSAQTMYETPPPSRPPGPVSPPPISPLHISPPPVSPLPAPAAPPRRSSGAWVGLLVGVCLLGLIAAGGLFAFRGSLGAILPGLAAPLQPTRTQARPTLTRPPARTPTPQPPTAAPATRPPTEVSGGAGTGLIRIVSQFPLTGPLAGLGQSAENGAKLAFDQLSGRLMKLGYPMEHVTMDDLGSPDAAGANANQVVTDPAALCVVGHLTSGASLNASEIYAGSNLGMVSPASTDPRVTERGLTNVFRVIGRADVEPQAAAVFARQELKADTAYIAFDNSDLGRVDAAAFTGAAQAQGLEVSGPSKPVSADLMSDVLTELQAFADSRGRYPDVIYFGGRPGAAREFFLTLRDAGVPSTFLGSSLIYSPELASPALTAAGGAFLASSDADAQIGGGQQQFADDYITRFGGPPGRFAALAYDAMRACLEAIERAAQTAGGRPPRITVTQAMRDIQFEGLTGPVRFNANGDRDPAPYFIFQLTATSPEAWPANPVIARYELSPP